MNRLLLVGFLAVSLRGQTIRPRVLLGPTQIDVPQIRGLAPSATIDATNAANISAGTLPSARLSAVPNAALSNSSVTVNAGAGLSTTSSSLPLGGTITLTASVPVNAQAGTSYIVSNADQAKLVTFNNSAPVLVTLPQAGAAGQFAANWSADFQNLGNGTVTITPTQSTINGASSLALAGNQGVRVVSDGSSYQIFALSTTNLAATGPGGVAGSLPAAKVSGLSASATTDVTNAANISSGTLSAARLPSSITSSTIWKRGHCDGTLRNPVDMFFDTGGHRHRRPRKFLGLFHSSGRQRLATANYYECSCEVHLWHNNHARGHRRRLSGAGLYTIWHGSYEQISFWQTAGICHGGGFRG